MHRAKILSRTQMHWIGYDSNMWSKLDIASIYVVYNEPLEHRVQATPFYIHL